MKFGAGSSAVQRVRRTTLQVVSKAHVTLCTKWQCHCSISPLGNRHGIPMERNPLAGMIYQGFEECGWNTTAVAVESMTTVKGGRKDNEKLIN